MDWIKLGFACVREAISSIKGVTDVKPLNNEINIQTNVDIVSHNSIVSDLTRSGVRCNVYSEEHEGILKVNGGDDSILFIVDPIDNTYLFLRGEQFFGCVALMILINNTPKYAFIGDILTGDIFHCDEQYAYKNMNQINLSRETPGRNIILAWAPYSPRLNQFQKLEKLGGKYLVFNYGGQLQAVKILTGNYDAYVEVVPEVLNEFCAAVIAKRAGAYVSQLDGKELVYVPNHKQTLIIARNKEIHDDIIDTFTGTTHA